MLTPSPERIIIESLFRIPDKDGNDVDFVLNEEQAILDSSLTGRDIVPKARQLGISTYFLGRGLAKCLSQRNTRAVVISHDRESTQRMLAKVHYMIENIRGPKPVIKTSSKNEITFPKMNSMFYLGTAGSRKFGRGDTISFLHCSEVAFWSDALELLTGLLQAAERGDVSLESTGNGMNDYHRRCMRAAEGKGRFKLHFFSWTDRIEYNYQLTPAKEAEVLTSLDPDLEEPEMLERGLTPGQIAWRRDKLDELDYDLSLFRQEYPLTLDECFRATGASLFHKVNFVPTSDWIQDPIDKHTWRLKEHPRPGKLYLIGGDPSGGVGKDNAAIQIFQLDNGEQVLEYAHDKISPDILAHKLKDLGREFNNAFISVESNNHGIVTVAELLDIYPNHLIYKMDFQSDALVDAGMRTTRRSKPLMIGKLRRMAVSDLTIHSPLLKAEMDSFVETETGALQAEDGCKDDRVMSCAVCIWPLEEAAYILQPPAYSYERTRDPFTIEGILEDLRSPREGLPFQSQV